jgi:hypothetical protein
VAGERGIRFPLRFGQLLLQIRRCRHDAHAAAAAAEAGLDRKLKILDLPFAVQGIRGREGC